MSVPGNLRRLLGLALRGLKNGLGSLGLPRLMALVTLIFLLEHKSWSTISPARLDDLLTAIVLILVKALTGV